MRKVGSPSLLQQPDEQVFHSSHTPPCWETVDTLKYKTTVTNATSIFAAWSPDSSGSCKLSGSRPDSSSEQHRKLLHTVYLSGGESRGSSLSRNSKPDCLSPS
jgi:hypothetical protein